MDFHGQSEVLYLLETKLSVMKNMYVFVVCLFIVGCSIDNTSSDSPKMIGFVLTNQEQKAVEDVRNEIKSLIGDDAARSNDVPSAFLDISNLNKFRLSFLPYYNFDIDEFYMNPSPEKMRQCIKLDPSLKWILARKDDSIKFKILVEKKNDSWRFMRHADEWGKILTWLNDTLKNASGYKLFLWGAREFFEIEKAGKYYYYTSLGKSFSEDKLCEYFVEMMNQKLENEKQIIKEGKEGFQIKE